MKESSPAFQFYPKDFLSDEHVVTMTMAQRGVYISLLCFCWVQDSIPNDQAAAARLCGATAAEMGKAWDVVSARFRKDEADPTRLRHKKLDELREQQREWREKSSRGGKQSAAMRQANLKGGSRVVQPDPFNTASASASASAKEPNPTLPDTYRKLIEAWPNPTGVDEGGRMWLVLIERGEVTADNAAEVFEGLRRWKGSKLWAEGFKPRVDKWLLERRWKDSPEQVEEKMEANW